MLRCSEMSYVNLQVEHYFVAEASNEMKMSSS